MGLSYIKYSLKNGTTKVKTKLAVGISIVALSLGMGGGTALLLSNAASAAPSYSVTPWVYVGAVDDCGPGYPAGTPGGVVSKWDSTTGLPAPSLRVEKNVPTTDCSAAGATINGVTGITLNQISFDYKDGSLCGGGAPRFNVDASDGYHFVGGCANSTQTSLGNSWTHVSIDTSNPTQAFPVLAPGATVNSIDLVLDEQGQTSLDNLRINGQLISGVTPTNKDDCKNNGWKNFVDTKGNSFKNQGDCVSNAATKGKNPAAGPAVVTE